jgi:histidyl-tRNA synthetase
MQKPSIPKGTRDFTPAEMIRREYIFITIRTVFKKFGYAPIETPAMENIETLTGKYGDEGDQLLFKILNSRPHDAKEEDKDKMRNAFEKILQQSSNSTDLTEKALRYDLTVPFARYVVQHRNEIVFPFKRYQIQPVWRADRPQKGRYREFYQCDADVIGSDSLLNEVELLQIIDEVFTTLHTGVTIKLNNRKILAGIAEVIVQKDKIVEITVALDKIEKVGREGFIEELRSKQISDKSINELCNFLFAKSAGIIGSELSNEGKIKVLKTWLADSEIGKKGIKELETVLDLIGTLKINTTIILDFTLARGLNYYTGTIIEVKANNVEIGSIAGGGRYDDLTGIFGLPGISGVGISFGADRIYDVLNQLEAFPPDVSGTTRLLVVNFGEREQIHCLSLLQKIRNAGIPAELYPENTKLKKQMEYANSRKIPYVLLAGEQEINSGLYALKNMNSGEQNALTVDQIIETLS